MSLPILPPQAVRRAQFPLRLPRTQIKRLEEGSFQWPRNGEEAKRITAQQYRCLMEQLRLLKGKQFGSSSGQTEEQLDGQLSLLFNEAEAYAASPGRQKSTQVAAHTRKQSGNVRDAAPDDIPVAESFLPANAPQECRVPQQ